ncbi:uncharacterized protein PGTG_19066 [Puccinia graminis f. sp. tritici CRL 75-36-700-3]|uniref:Aminotransferase class I/classII large domain-containing protein n=2 Tax=Puccinia graminis f. sp. tritici TaxID=56615 RepID=E3L9S3_PUCGT|nr:uncharacterized protein PGTG_19066 [Puccinia graminis f. sp. tritici CRL 75-36-700-3]EFP93298.2 hypothetical protein PGTG_19066 [Puccinia graminis f. sp. tritici CRL 75-36-700-3]
MSPSNLSLRSTKQLPGQPNVTAKAIADAWKDLYSEDKNPDGVINLGVAENSLMQEFLVEKVKESISRFEARHLNYQSLGGSSSFKEAMCHILNQHFNPFTCVKPEHLISASGVTAILAQLMYAVCDEGDGVLISKPYYSGFNHLVKQGVHLIGFEIEDPLDPRWVSQALDQTYLNHHGQPHRIKSVILCNPHNPMGYYVQEEVLSTYVRFCEANDLHLIVDEIYGLSVFEAGPTTNNDDPAPQKVPDKFISALSLDPHRHSFDPSRLHILYGISKDFGCCGLRAGVLISQHNSDLLRLITDLNLNQVQVSSLTEFCFSNLILNNSDHPDHQEFLESYLIESKKRLLKAHQTVTEKLKELKIDYNNPSNGGFFLMIDLSRYLREPSDLNKDKQTAGGSRTEEEKLFQILLKEYKIYMAPGNVYNYPKPGFFRLTFTVPPDHLDLGLQRLARFMESYETLPPMSNLQISR